MHVGYSSVELVDTVDEVRNGSFVDALVVGHDCGVAELYHFDDVAIEVALLVLFSEELAAIGRDRGLLALHAYNY